MKSSLDPACLELVAQATFQKTTEIGFQHAQQNLPYMKQTVLDLPRTAPEKGTSAISMAAGPSLHRRGTIQTIKDLDYRGTLVVADGAMGHCLRNGLIPDYVVCVDPHRPGSSAGSGTRIWPSGRTTITSAGKIWIRRSIRKSGSATTN